jgi:hypothetical protein
MMFFDQLKAHIGGLVRLKTDLYWYDSSSWDRVKDRMCLLLDVGEVMVHPFPRGHPALRNLDATGHVPHPDELIPGEAVLLLIDGSCKRIWISKRDVELIQ